MSKSDDSFDADGHTPEYLPERYPTAAEMIRQDRDSDNGHDPDAYLASLTPPTCTGCTAPAILVACNNRVSRGGRSLDVLSKVWTCSGSCRDAAGGPMRWVDGPLWLWTEELASDAWSARYAEAMPPSESARWPAGSGVHSSPRAPLACSQGFADLAGTIDFDPDYDFRAVRARGRVRGGDTPGKATAAEVAVVLESMAANTAVPAHRQRLIAALAAAVRDGTLEGGDSDGDPAAVRG